MKIDARLTFNKVQFDQDAEAHLVLSVTAPAVTGEAKRPPLCFVPLIDVSPSMEGDKLTYAKKSLIKLIDHLTPNDYCGLIEFSHDARVLQKPVRCTLEAKEDLKRKVGDLRLSGATNIASALLEGFAVANNMDLPAEVITRVILFTDGAANTGPAKTPAEILALVKPNIGIASVSAFGYGNDAQQDFLLDLAKAGNGNYAFIKNPDDALSAFGKELGGLLSTHATNLVLEVSPLAGHQVMRVISDVEVEDEALGQISIKIPDILSEETRHIVIGVKLQAQKNAFPREVNVFDVKVGYDTLDANLRREHKSLEVKAKVQFVKAGEEQKSVDKDLDQIVGLAQIVRAQIEAEAHAKVGNYRDASAVMDAFSASVKTRGLMDLGVLAQDISSRVGSQVSYTSTGNSAYMASISRGATRGVGGTYDVGAAAVLRSAGVMMSNAAQDLTAAAFTADDALTANGFTLGGALINPAVDPGQSWVNPAVDPGQSWVNPAVDPGQPWANLAVGPGQTTTTHSLPFLVQHAVLPVPTPEVKKPRAKAAKAKKGLAQKSSRW